MTVTQKLLGNILRNRINEELKKIAPDYTTIQETMDALSEKFNLVENIQEDVKEIKNKINEGGDKS